VADKVDVGLGATSRRATVSVGETCRDDEDVGPAGVDVVDTTELVDESSFWLPPRASGCWYGLLCELYTTIPMAAATAYSTHKTFSGVAEIEKKGTY
jgi:hypothetical protein